LPTTFFWTLGGGEGPVSSSRGAEAPTLSVGEEVDNSGDAEVDASFGNHPLVVFFSQLSFPAQNKPMNELCGR
jgi:hypothetical protein